MNKDFVVWFKDVDKEDIASVGGKGANLGEMTKVGIPVPNGFIVTAQAYYYFLEASEIKPKLHDILRNLDVSISADLERVANKIQHLIETTAIPPEISKLIIKYYQSLGSRFNEPFVAVRSSATAEDLPQASFAGQQSTFLNIKGEASVVYHVRRCWASLFTARAIFYRVENKFDHFKVGIAVPVQKMVQSHSSGIMFTADPVTSDKNKIIIEAIYGLGELIVSGAVTPDHYEINKKDLEILSKHTAPQDHQMIRHAQKTIIEKISPKLGEKQKITDDQMIKLAKLGKKLEQHYYFPQDIEWAIEDNEVYITQTRPITTLNHAPEKGSNFDKHEVVHTHVVLLKGDPASPGIASGPVCILKSVAEMGKVKKGDILVAPQTNPDYVPAMRKVAAIITETGGRTSHAAIVSRELGIPAVVGATGALKKLADGQMVTVHGSRGVVYKGGVAASSIKVTGTNLTGNAKNMMAKLKTATRLYVNLAEPEKAFEVAKMNVEGVGLLRAEFMIAGIGVHPKKMIKDHKEEKFIEQLSSKLATFCEAFYPRPVVYRATDFRTNEYRNLVGGAEFEPQESNPMLGYRGAFRYISDPAVFNLELEAIKRVRNKQKFNNLWLMIPFVHTPHELLQVKKLVAASGLNRGPSFKLWMMVELPANVILLEKFIEVGIDGVSIGSNDLTMLVLGVDRDNSEVSSVFDERNPAVQWAIEHVVKTCAKHNITASICGQAPSDYPELVEKLVEWGITSMSVNRDVVDQVRETIYHAEQKLVGKPKKTK